MGMMKFTVDMALERKIIIIIIIPMTMFIVLSS